MSDNRIKSFPEYEEILQKQNQRKNKKFVLFSFINSLVFFVLGIFLSLFVLGDFVGFSGRDAYYKKLMQIYDIVSQEWYFGEGESSNQDFVERALDAMINQQADDAYLTYYPAETEATYGIGVTIGYFSGYLLVHQVISGSPSDGELLAGDIITKVNDIDIRDLSYSAITALIRGEDGSSVSLEVVRGSTTIQKQITRGNYTLLTTEGQIVADYGVLKIRGFENDTVSGAKTILDGFVTNNIDKLVIDLRDNGGGYIMAFTALADLFTPKGAIFGVYKHKDSSNDYTAKSENNPRYSFDQIIVLTNENTASASESFAAALKDNLTSVSIIGTTTYGKGIAQKTITFSDGSKLRYTYAEYYRKGDVKLHQVGVTPDIVLPEEGSHTILEAAYAENETFSMRIKSYLVARGFGSSSDDLTTILQAYQSAKSIAISATIDHATLIAIMQDYYSEKQQAMQTQLQGAVAHFS